jgi:Beta-1,3-glucanase
MRVDRRAFLASLASTGVLAACSARDSGSLDALSGGHLVPPLRARDPQAKLLLTNSSRDSPVYYYVVGRDGPGGPWSYLKADGSIARAVPGANFAIPLSALPNPTCPKFDSARVLVSIGKKLTLKVDERTGEPVTPPGWVKNNPDYDVLYDWVEYTYDANGLGCNTSFVDMTSLPLALKLTGANGEKRVGPQPGAGPRIYVGMREHAHFGNLIVTSGGRDLRVIAPGHGIESDVFPADYLDAYIADCWDYFKNNDLSVTYQWPVGKTLNATGRVDAGGKFTFKRAGKLVRSIPKPTTKDVFFCNGALLAENDEGEQIAAVIGAALNRTVLRGTSSQPQCTSSGFYTNEHTNFYSLVLHQNTIDGLCYGFPFDDICNLFSSYIHDSAPSQLEITIGKN